MNHVKSSCSEYFPVFAAMIEIICVQGEASVMRLSWVVQFHVYMGVFIMHFPKQQLYCMRPELTTAQSGSNPYPEAELQYSWARSRSVRKTSREKKNNIFVASSVKLRSSDIWELKVHSLKALVASELHVIERGCSSVATATGYIWSIEQTRAKVKHERKKWFADVVLSMMNGINYQQRHGFFSEGSVKILKWFCQDILRFVEWAVAKWLYSSP